MLPSAPRPRKCRSPHGERGLKYQRRAGIAKINGRSPHGERGLKYCVLSSNLSYAESLPTRGAWIEIRSLSFVRCSGVRSLPTRGAWIEIGRCNKIDAKQARRSPHGERGLKLLSLDTASQVLGRSPHGERGLKYADWIIFVVFDRRSPHGERGLK